MEFSDLSPSDEAWSSGVTRKHSTGKKLVATIVNAGEVNATVTVSVDTAEDNVKVYGLESDSNDASATEVSWGDYDKATVLSLFTVDLYYNTDNDAGTATEFTSGTALSDALAPENTYYIYAAVTWTTADSGEIDGTAGDALDTWVGNNVGSIVYNLSYTAVQASKVPADAGD